MTHKNRQSGFTIIVLAIMLSIIGTLLVTAVPTESSKVKREFTITREKLAVIKRNLEVYKSVNGGYPCPAPRDGTGAFAANDCNPSACQSLYDDAPCDNDSNTIVTTGTTYSTSTGVMIGAVPVRSLNLPDTYVTDEWGKQFVYAIDRGKAKGGDNSNSISIRNEANNTVRAEFALLSVGPNGKGGYNRAGTQSPACSSSDANEQENCDNDASFAYKSWKRSGGATTYDDIPITPWVVVIPCPGEVPGCVLWLDATDIDGDGSSSSGEPAENNDITTWVDKSGNGRNATQANSAKRPQYKATGLNSKPSIYFNRTANDHLNIASSQWSTGGDYTIFVVRRLTGSSNGTTWFTGVGHSYLGANISSFYASGIYDMIQNYYGNNLVYGPSYSNAFNRSEIITMRYSNSRYGATYKNGVKIIADYSGGVIPASTANLAASISYDGLGIEGNVSEVAAYPTALSDANREAVECALANKYNIIAPHCQASGCPSTNSCPANLTDCKFWYDASDPSYLRKPVTNGDGKLLSFTASTTNGQDVGIWCDKSSSGNNAYYLNTPTTYSADALGSGLHGVQTNYTQGIMVNELPSFTDASNYFTITFVLSPNVGAPRPSGINGTTGVDRMPIWGNYINSYNIYGYANYGGDSFMTDNHSTTYSTSPGTLKSGVPVIFTVRQSASPARTLWLNGAKTSETSATALPKYPHGDIFGALPGKYAEIVKFNKALSDVEVDSLHTYLASKWGISVDNDFTGSCPAAPASCPESTTNCTYWFDASDTSYILNSAHTAVTNNGEAVAAWCDKSGNLRNAISIGSPSYQTDTFGSGKNSVRSSTSGGSLLAPISPAPTNSRSFFAVMRSASSLPAAHSMLLSTHNATGSDHSMLSYTTTLYNYADLTNSHYSTSAAIATNTNYILSGRMVHGSTNTLYRNGTSSSYANSYLTSAKPMPLTIGATSADFGEVIYYSTAQSASDHKKIECYLADKWGMCGQLPAAHCNTDAPTKCCGGSPSPNDPNTNGGC